MSRIGDVQVEGRWMTLSDVKITIKLKVVTVMTQKAKEFRLINSSEKQQTNYYDL